jgi:membrane-bound serine protease (ClpP class)
METNKLIVILLLLSSVLLPLISGPDTVFGAEQHNSRPLVYLLDVDGTINPAVADFISAGIQKAEKNHAEALIIRMDTPGGVLETTKTIIKNMVNASVPVVVYVAPNGSSAASAGSLITMASDVAAMAPGTNLGAAHPVGSGGEQINATMSKKIENDLTAYMRAIVASKGRNANWAEQAIKESASITAKQALKIKVIDLIADSVPDLLNQLDGKQIEKNNSVITLHTKGTEVVTIPPGWRFKILDVIANPNIAYILMMIGAVGLIAEFYHPGAMLPGVAGGISLFLAFYALQILPVDYTGILLIILAIVLFILELKMPSFGLLSIGAVISLTLGSIMLFNPQETGMRVSWSVLVPTVSLVSSFFIVALGLVVKARRKKPITGQEGLVGEIGLAITDLYAQGKVFVHGEYWNARAKEHIRKNERIKVTQVDNLRLLVTRDVT